VPFAKGRLINECLVNMDIIPGDEVGKGRFQAFEFYGCHLLVVVTCGSPELKTAARKFEGTLTYEFAPQCFGINNIQIRC
jgi:hypothetical protein